MGSAPTSPPGGEAGEGREGRGKGREGWKEGETPAGRAAGAGSRGPHEPRGRVVTPVPVPRHPGKGKSRREAAGGGTVDGTERARDWDTDKRALG